MIAVLGISHKDTACASMWFDHLRWLGAGRSTHKLEVYFTDRVPSRSHGMVAGCQGYDVTSRILNIRERGYPGSASELFVVAMSEAAKMYPGEPLLWMEADAIPIRADWMDVIGEEYAGCDRPFMGHLEADHAIPHLAGVAVYPSNWSELSPMLASSHLAPDIPYFGRGKGQAFDAYAAPEVFPQSRQAVSIQQVFGMRHWRVSDVGKIRPGAAVVHQSKDGSLIRLIQSGHINRP